MAGIDAYTKLMLHCNGVDGSTSFPDDSGEGQTVSVVGTAEVDTAQSKFGGASLICDGSGASLSVTDFSELDLGTNDFTFDFWVRFASLAGVPSFFTRETNGTSYFYLALEGSGTNLRFRDFVSGEIVDIQRTVSLSIDTWYHIAVTRSGNDFRIFLNGVQQGATYTSSNSLTARTDNLLIGAFPLANYKLNGWIDEFRFSYGIARWTSNFTPPTSEYTTEDIDEEETIVLSDESELTGLGLETKSEEIFLFDEISFPIIYESEEIFLSDTSNFFLTTKKILSTDFRTLVAKIGQVLTNLKTKLSSSLIYNTKLHLKLLTSKLLLTDLRLRFEEYDALSLGKLNDFIVKLDGTELTDVDYSTLKIEYNLNSTPSRATFILARHHDDLDHKLDNSNSEITDENKIEVYDDSIKIFTGYITEINALSQNDTVEVTAEDVRYKISKVSMELEYGGKYKSNDNPQDESDVTKIEKNIDDAVLEVLSEINSLISGYDPLPFSGTFVPQYVKTYDNCANLMDNLIRLTSTANWYIDVNEKLKYTQVGKGIVKKLALSSIDKRRHPYDTILNDITLNRKGSNYAKSLNIKLGKHIIKKWARTYFSGWINFTADWYNSLREKMGFMFQRWGEQGTDFYVGIWGGRLYGYTSSNGWTLKPTLVIQYMLEDSFEDLPDVTVGSGEPQETLFLDSYGKQEGNLRWEERRRESDQKTYLVYVTDESYDYTNFANDFANFELSQRNQLTTEANITLLLDAYEYYNINFSDRINLSNTLISGIYSNNNGFPLNIDKITINCATRIVTLHLTNYGKSNYTRTANFVKSFTPAKVSYVLKKQPMSKVSGA